VTANWSDLGLRLSGTIVLAVMLLGLVALFVPYDPADAVSYERLLQAPSWDHLMGTDGQGRDVAMRLVKGTEAFFLPGLAGALVAVVLGGLAGAYMATALQAGFGREMTAGRGYIALAALIFAKWRPWGALWATLLFGFFQALALRPDVVEGVAGVPLHKQNFRRALERSGLVEGLGRLDQDTGGRPAELFRFRREVLAARPVSGLSLPLLRD
jgi:hypothetical protein